MKVKIKDLIQAATVLSDSNINTIQFRDGYMYIANNRVATQIKLSGKYSNNAKYIVNYFVDFDLKEYKDIDTEKYINIALKNDSIVIGNTKIHCKLDNSKPREIGLDNNTLVCTLPTKYIKDLEDNICIKIRGNYDESHNKGNEEYSYGKVNIVEYNNKNVIKIVNNADCRVYNPDIDLVLCIGSDSMKYLKHSKSRFTDIYVCSDKKTIQIASDGIIIDVVNIKRSVKDKIVSARKRIIKYELPCILEFTSSSDIIRDNLKTLVDYGVGFNYYNDNIEITGLEKPVNGIEICGVKRNNEECMIITNIFDEDAFVDRDIVIKGSELKTIYNYVKHMVKNNIGSRIRIAFCASIEKSICCIYSIKDDDSIEYLVITPIRIRTLFSSRQCTHNGIKSTTDKLLKSTFDELIEEFRELIEESV